MRDLPVVLDGYRLTVVEPPAPKTRLDDDGNEVEVTDRDGVRVFAVSLFAKLRATTPGQRVPKGEEIKVTLSTDPGMGFEEDVRVQLIDPTISPFALESGNGRTVSGISWRARGMKLAGTQAPARGKASKDGGGEGES